MPALLALYSIPSPCLQGLFLTICSNVKFSLHIRTSLSIYIFMVHFPLLKKKVLTLFLPTVFTLFTLILFTSKNPQECVCYQSPSFLLPVKPIQISICFLAFHQKVPRRKPGTSHGYIQRSFLRPLTYSLINT